MKILVTGMGGPAGSAVAELLLARDFQVVGTDMREIELPGAQFRLVPAAREPGFLDALAEIAAQEGADLLIPTVTEELPVVAAGWRKLSRHPGLVFPFPRAVEIADDKYLTAQALQRRRRAGPALRAALRGPFARRRGPGWAGPA